MRKACIVVPEFYQANRLFDLSDTRINRDGCMVPLAMLRQEFARNDVELSTQDVNAIEDSDYVIYSDMPSMLPRESDIEKSFLLLYETELILPQNWDFSKHRYFRKIFTWDDTLVDGKKYIKINWPQVFPDKLECFPGNKSKFCCLIAGNKSSGHQLELYSKRIEAIRWFEKHHPEAFELYGMGWNEFHFPNFRFVRNLNRFDSLKALFRVFAPNYPSYRGRIEEKVKTMRQFKYSICYENAGKLSGYITEKIFDCFFSSCVPIYWGAENISSHIPPDCYIDKRVFPAYEELYDFLRCMSPSAYSRYLEAAREYLLSEASYPFTAEYYVKTLVGEIIRKIASG